MYARGLSVRDIEAAFRDARGASVLSRTAVSQVTERLWQEYEAFASRDLSEFALAYFFVDGVAERLHAGLPREAVLCAWGITEDGRKVLLHLAPGTKEDTASCTAFFEDLKRRGLADPLLAVTDGAPGLIRAVETCFPRALRQRCLVHRMRNLRSKAPESQWPEIALRARGCYEAASPALAAVLRDDCVAAYERDLPAARVVPLGDDSVEFGPVDLGHDPWIHLLLAEVGRRHHAERREQAALDGSVVLEQRLIGNGSLVALDRLEDGAADEVVWRLSDRPSVTFRPACPVPRRGHECTSVEP